MRRMLHIFIALLCLTFIQGEPFAGGYFQGMRTADGKLTYKPSGKGYTLKLKDVFPEVKDWDAVFAAMDGREVDKITYINDDCVEVRLKNGTKKVYERNSNLLSNDRSWKQTK